MSPEQNIEPTRNTIRQVESPLGKSGIIVIDGQIASVEISSMNQIFFVPKSHDEDHKIATTHSTVIYDTFLQMGDLEDTEPAKITKRISLIDKFLRLWPEAKLLGIEPPTSKDETSFSGVPVIEGEAIDQQTQEPLGNLQTRLPIEHILTIAAPLFNRLVNKAAPHDDGAATA